MPVITMYSYFW